MHRARVPHEVDPGPGVGGKERRRELISLQLITVAARENDVAMAMCAAVGKGINVVERRRVEIESGAAIDTASPTVAHGGALDGALVTGSAEDSDSGAPLAM
jgi:hypothetical protein